MTTRLDLDGPHWKFALVVYGRPGVSEACLLLQDRCGVDVNVLLIGLYAWTAGDDAFAARILDRVDAAAAPLREEVVKPLRRTRRRMKEMAETIHGQPWEALRDRIKKAEIAAEQFEQAILAVLVSPSSHAPAPGGARDAVENIVRFYAARSGDPRAANDVGDAVATIAAAAVAAAGLR